MQSKFVFVVPLLLLAAACSKSSGSNGIGSNMGMPGKSITTISPDLYRSATTSVRKYVKSQLSCDDYRVIDTQPLATLGDLAMDNSGRLIRGGVQEEWKIEYCDYSAVLGIEMAADGQGGTFVAVERLDKAESGQGIGHAMDEVGSGPRYLGKQ